MKSASQIKSSFTRLVPATLGIAFVVLAAGCAKKPTGLPTALGDRSAREQHGYIYYLDGAGGGTAKNNWAGGVKDGLIAAGYNGAGEMYSWETGKGLMADQDASVKYKRAQAKGLAEKIVEREKAYPGVPLNVLSFSAGAASAVFALEALPETVQVDRIVMLGCSISEDYDLTKALKHVKGKMYLYTSTHDEMVGFLMKFSGTADRKFHDPGAGIKGFVLPKGASAETRKLYAEKIVVIPWKKKELQDGNKGHHFDNIKMPFIRDYVAPILMGEGVPDPS